MTGQELVIPNIARWHIIIISYCFTGQREAHRGGGGETTQTHSISTLEISISKSLSWVVLARTRSVGIWHTDTVIESLSYKVYRLPPCISISVSTRSLWVTTQLSSGPSSGEHTMLFVISTGDHDGAPLLASICRCQE